MPRGHWISIECRFAGMFSYRIPDFSSFYALASPVPSPSTVKLALVAGAIRATANPRAGVEFFDSIRDAHVALAPARGVGASRVLVRRLRAPKQTGSGFTTSFGIREYLHLSGPLHLFIRVPESALEMCLEAAIHLRYLGTSDSLMTTVVREDAEPEWSRCAREVSATEGLPEEMRGRLIVPLNDLTRKAKADHFHPIRGKRKRLRSALEQRMYVLPLKVRNQDGKCIVYESAPFEDR